MGSFAGKTFPWFLLWYVIVKALEKRSEKLWAKILSTLGVSIVAKGSENK